MSGFQIPSGIVINSLNPLRAPRPPREEKGSAMRGSGQSEHVGTSTRCAHMLGSLFRLTLEHPRALSGHGAFGVLFTQGSSRSARQPWAPFHWPFGPTLEFGHVDATKGWNTHVTPTCELTASSGFPESLNML